MLTTTAARVSATAFWWSTWRLCQRRDRLASMRLASMRLASMRLASNQRTTGHNTTALQSRRSLHWRCVLDSFTARALVALSTFALVPSKGSYTIATIVTPACREIHVPGQHWQLSGGSPVRCHTLEPIRK